MHLSPAPTIGLRRAGCWSFIYFLVWAGVELPCEGAGVNWVWSLPLTGEYTRFFGRSGVGKHKWAVRYKNNLQRGVKEYCRLHGGAIGKLAGFAACGRLATIYGKLAGNLVDPGWGRAGFRAGWAGDPGELVQFVAQCDLISIVPIPSIDSLREGTLLRALFGPFGVL